MFGATILNPRRFVLSTFNQIAFLNFAAVFSNIISITQSVADHLLIFQEALRPSKDVQYVIEQYRTGAFSPRPTLYNNFYHGSGLGVFFEPIYVEDPRWNILDRFT